jgi:hypothetical protein
MVSPRQTALLVVLPLVLQGCALHHARVQDGIVTEASVRAHLEFLASDAMNGRGSGTRDEDIAAEYVAAEFRRLGLEPADSSGRYVQAVTLTQHTASAKPTIRIQGSGTGGIITWTAGADFVVAALGEATIAGPLQRITGPETRVTPGAIAYLPQENFGRAFDLITGGVTVLLMRGNPTEQRLRQASSQPIRLEPELTDLPAESRRPRTLITLTSAAARVLDTIPDGTRIAIDTQTAPPQISHTYNAVGVLRGRDPVLRNEVVLISAHLDHLGRVESAQGADKIFNGADDDASGTVAVMELAAALASRRPKRTIVFACFGSEENGGYGATYLREKPPVPLGRIVADVEFEMIGRPDPKVPAHTLWLTGYERSDLGAALAAHGARLVADPHPEENFFRRSDNYSFALRGVVAHTVSSYGLHKEYHTPRDETRLIDYAHMREAIASMIEPLAWLASSPFKPQWRSGQNPAK